MEVTEYVSIQYEWKWGIIIYSKYHNAMRYTLYILNNERNSILN